MKRKLNIKKVCAITMAAVMSGAVLFGGTYAWHMISQQAKNEVLSKKLNPGGRLHDDFNGINIGTLTGKNAVERKVKNVYVENFTDPDDHGEAVYARIRLDEYMEIGQGAGEATGSITKEAKPIIEGKEIENEAEWTTYVWEDPMSKFRKYVTLGTGGETVYMPTYNKDKDSLEADINGTLAGPDRDKQTMGDAYGDHEKYVYDENALQDPDKTSVKWGVEIYDANGKGIDELKAAGIKVEQIIEAIMDTGTGKLKIDPSNHTSLDLGDGKAKLPITADTSGNESVIYVRMHSSDTEAAVKAVVPKKPHTAKRTLCTEEVIAMADWKKSKDAGGKGGEAGPYWVADTDGWFYWAWPVEPDTATGCLLNSISLNTGTTEGKNLSGKDYYYGLNVVAQFATVNDWGNESDKTGFYASGMTKDGEALLKSVSATDEGSVGIVIPDVGNEAQEAVPGSTVTMSFKLRKSSGEEAEVDQSRVVWSLAGEEAGAVMETAVAEVTKTGFYDPEHPNVLSIAKNETRTSLTVIGCYTDAKGKRFTQSCIVQVVPAQEEVPLTFPVYTIHKSGNDKDNFVILIMGDGYTADQQEKFVKDATVRAKGMLTWSPYKDYSDRINIYAVQAVSNESGLSDYWGDSVDTYFHITAAYTALNFGKQEGIDRANALRKELEDEYLDSGASVGTIHFLLNTSGDFGSSKNPLFSFSAADSGSVGGATMAHELAHSIGGLGDEYDVKKKGENTSKTSEPAEIEWNKLLGFRGVGITQAGISSEGSTEIFAPGRYCMMRERGRDFCEVCKMELARKLNNKDYVYHPDAYYIAEPEITIPHTLGETLAYDKNYRISETNITKANGKDLEFRTVIQNIANEDLVLEVSFRIIGADGNEKYSKTENYTVSGLSNWYDPQAARESLSVVLEGVTGLVYGDKLEGKVVNKKTGEILTDQTKIDQKWSKVNISYQRLTGSGAEEMPEIAPTTIYVPKGSTYQLNKIPLRGATFVKNSLETDSVVVSGDTLDIIYYYQ